MIFVFTNKIYSENEGGGGKKKQQQQQQRMAFPWRPWHGEIFKKQKISQLPLSSKSPQSPYSLLAHEYNVRLSIRGSGDQVEMASNNFTIASCSNEIKLWDITSQKELNSFYPHKGAINCLRWNHNSNKAHFA